MKADHAGAQAQSHFGLDSHQVQQVYRDMHPALGYTEGPLGDCIHYKRGVRTSVMAQGWRTGCSPRRALVELVSTSVAYHKKPLKSQSETA